MTAGRRLRTLTGACVLVLSIVQPATVQAQQTGGETVVYRPPLRGAPAAASRVGGGVRGTGGEPVTLGVLAPGHVALTTTPQPTLYWFVSRPVGLEAELTVVRPGVAEPVLDVWLAPPIDAGIHALALAEHDVTLEPGVEYRWFVALVTDHGNRSTDVVAGGEVQLEPPDAALQARLAAATEAQRPAILAGAGYWYDTLQGLSAMVARAAGNPGARGMRAELLDAAGLVAAAAYERSETR